MEITLIRIASDADSTLGVMYINGLLQGFTLEDEYRAKKVWGETRIPSGRYQITLRTVGGLHQKYHNHRNEEIRKMHKGMLWLQNVPGFEFILIHIGNTEKDTAGCILVGDVAAIIHSGPEVIRNSTQAYITIYRKVMQAIDSGEGVWISIRDMDKAVKTELQTPIA